MPQRSCQTRCPPKLQLVIKHCLEKEPERRYERAQGVRAALEAIHAGTGLPRAAWRALNDVERKSSSGEHAHAPSWRRSAGVSLLLLLLVLLTAGFWAWQPWRATGTREPLRFVALTTAPGIERYPSISSDGNNEAFMWTGPKQDNADIYVQMLGAGSPVGAPLRLTTDSGSDQNPVWSPDGRWIAFLHGQPTQSLVLGPGLAELRLIPPLGGPQRKVAELRYGPSHPLRLLDCLVSGE